MEFPQFYEWGVLESVCIKNGLIIIEGWAENVPNINLYGLNTNYYRTFRPDVANELNVQNHFYGFISECVFTGQTLLYINNQYILKIEGDITLPDYFALLDMKSVVHRDGIYGYGEPIDNVAAEILCIVRNLNGNVLDFGCGKGATVKLLRDNGINAYGLEIDREAIRNSLEDSLNQYIKLYNGDFPLQYADDEFDNTICIEVLEHITDYQTTIKEISRISKNKVIITVPDISAIPRLHQFNVVPWHLLESTHVNFFTLQSLYSELKPYFNNIEFAKICPMHINGEIIFTNLVAICTK